MERPVRTIPTLLSGAARWALRAALTAIALLGLYVAAALAGALLTGADGPSDVSADGGGSVAIYVATNGFHTDLILPARSAGRDWGDVLRRSPITRERLADTRWVAFGWGSRTAYTRLGKVTDLTPAIALKALAFDVSVVHVAPFAAIREGDEVRRIELTGSGYRRLAAFIDASFAGKGAEGPVPLPGVTHGYGDAFFRGSGRFSFLRGCNVWVGEALRRGGYRTGLWTPFAQSLMWSAGL